RAHDAVAARTTEGLERQLRPAHRRTPALDPAEEPHQRAKRVSRGRALPRLGGAGDSGAQAGKDVCLRRLEAVEPQQYVLEGSGRRAVDGNGWVERLLQ